MEQEVALLYDRMGHSILWQMAGCEIYSGQLYGAEVALVKSGIGKVSAAMGTTLLLDHFKPELVINIGTAGGLVPSLKIGDIVVSNQVSYHDVDMTVFGYEFGQMTQCPASFNSDLSLIALVEEIANRIGINAICGLLISGDSFINGAERLANIRQTFPQAIALDMESTAIAHVCYRFAVPFIVVRAISDIADTASKFRFNECCTVAAKSSSRIVEELVRVLAQRDFVEQV